MKFESIKPIYGFPDGLTVACYLLDGREAVVGGATDGIKVYPAAPGEQDYVKTHITEHTEDVTCLASSKTKFASGGTDGLVLLYNNNTVHSFDKILVRSTVPIRSLAFHPDGTKLAIATDDNDIRVVLVADNSKIVLLKGHKHTVKSICYDPKGNYMLSSDVQGHVFIWAVGPHESAPRIVNTLAAVIYKSSMDSILQSTVTWNPDGTVFAFPGTNQDIRVFTSGIWKLSYALEGGHTEDIVTLAWSPNGYYLASACKGKLLVVWDTKTKTKITSDVNSTEITSLHWQPDGNQLLVTDAYGQIKFWDNVISTRESQLPHPAKMRVVKEQPAKTLELHELVHSQASDEMDDDLGDDVNMLFDDDDEGEDLGDMGEDVADFVIDDDGAGYVETPEEAAATLGRVKTQQTLNVNNANNQALIKRQQKLELAFDPPTTFQPGETPYHKPETNKSFDPAQGERRYMAYNLVGIITTIFEEAHSIINVEFHDQTAYRNFHFTDPNNYSMAAISTAGTVYAVESKTAVNKGKKLNADGEESESEDEEETTLVNSILYYRPNNTGAEKDWTHHMLPGEDVVSIAVNRVSVIAITSLGYVRIFTTSGVQRHVFSLDNIVTMAAMVDLALIVYSTGPSFTGQQNLNYILLNTDSNEILQRDHVHVTPDSELCWVGFSETNQAAVFDTAGVMRVLQRQRRPDQGCWVPVFDGKAHAAQLEKTEKYWPVGLLRDRLMCVVLRGNNPYPFFPRPPVKDIPLQLPLLEMNTEVGGLEQEVLRVNTCKLHEKDEAEATNAEEDYVDAFKEADSEMDIALLKLINLACKSEKVSRALDLANALHSLGSIDKAIRIASFHRFSSLAQKLTQIKETKFMGDEVETSTLADSFAALPSIYTSRESALDGDLSLINQFKRKDMSYMLMDDDDSMMHLSDDEHLSKRSKPFQFSS
ncbi:WD40-repeat-containing domain protein [Mucor mucedo]|uniref:WD40-repeat-containing domain protein n=1 Tax=Mucor mucedo TaxID=29922 RepID=UPI00221F01A0|nr:WD40-repeat-containing domain protein [Mucor mucedo]KAI7867064.1 WD40-repeat-containing domain protein [Mucor mucedo]